MEQFRGKRFIDSACYNGAYGKTSATDENWEVIHLH